MKQGRSSARQLKGGTVRSGYALWLDRGITTFDMLSRKNKSVTLLEWTEAFSARWPQEVATDVEGESDEQERLLRGRPSTHWIWRTVLSIPLAESGRQRSSVVRAGSHEIVEVFAHPAEFVVKLGSYSGMSLREIGLYMGAGRSPAVLLRTLEPVRLIQGNLGYLRCMPVRCELWIPVSGARARAVEQAALGDEVEVIATYDHALCVGVKSFNHAHTVASRRLESQRLSRGGNIFPRVAWTDRKGTIPLEEIRAAVEGDRWGGPGQSGLHPTRLDGVDPTAPDAPPWPCRRDGSVDLGAWGDWRSRQT